MWLDIFPGIRRYRETTRDLIATYVTLSNGWTQHQMAVDFDNNPCLPGDDAACKWCMYGACYRALRINKVGMDDWDDRLRRLRAAINKALTGYGDNMIGFNDAAGRTQHEVLRLLDRIIQNRWFYN